MLFEEDYIRRSYTEFYAGVCGDAPTLFRFHAGAAGDDGDKIPATRP